MASKFIGQWIEIGQRSDGPRHAKGLHWNGSRAGSFSVGMEVHMGLAEYMIVAKGNGWSVLHDGSANHDYESKEAAFESAVAAASLALREGHEVHIGVPGREPGNGAAPGVKE
jgi:hypothetical protein